MVLHLHLNGIFLGVRSELMLRDNSAHTLMYKLILMTLYSDLAYFDQIRNVSDASDWFLILLYDAQIDFWFLNLLYDAQTNFWLISHLYGAQIITVYKQLEWYNWGSSDISDLVHSHTKISSLLRTIPAYSPSVLSALSCKFQELMFEAKRVRSWLYLALYSPSKSIRCTKYE